MRKELPQKLLRELLKNSKRSDRELAKILKVSQPTVTRTRHNLEKNGTIQDYTIVPNFWKIGFELLAITFTKGAPGTHSKQEVETKHEEARKIFGKMPNVIFVSSGEGLGMTGMIFSLHTSYTAFHQFLNMLRLDWQGYIGDMKSFVISLKEEKFKKFSLAHLGDLPL